MNKYMEVAVEELRPNPLIAGSIPRFVDAWERGYYAGNKGIIVIPVWPVRLIIVIGAATVIIVFLGRVRGHLNAIVRGEESEPS